MTDCGKYEENLLCGEGTVDLRLRGTRWDVAGQCVAECLQSVRSPRRLLCFPSLCQVYSQLPLLILYSVRCLHARLTQRTRAVPDIIISGVEDSGARTGEKWRTRRWRARDTCKLPPGPFVNNKFTSKNVVMLKGPPQSATYYREPLQGQQIVQLGFTCQGRFTSLMQPCK